MRSSLGLLAAALLAIVHGVTSAPSTRQPEARAQDSAPSPSASSYTPAASDSNGQPLAVCGGCNNTGNTYPAPPTVYSTDPHVKTGQGVYAGQHLSGIQASDTFSGIGIDHAQHLFLGIPYAKPPVGSRRYRRPSHLDSEDQFNETRPAKRRAVQCMGVGTSHNYNPPLIELAIGEDCLALDVIRPASTRANDKLPVLVYIHGGGFNQGGTADLRYNGSWIVDRSVQMGTPLIYVGIQYRLEALGFPLGYEAAALNLTNLGLYDQRVALHWLRDNIGHFGGDKDKVTIMGESAGAASIYVHYTAYGGRDENLFRAAVAHSGYFALSASGEEARNEKMQNFTSLLGCGGKGNAEDTYACLRQVDFATFAAVERENFAAAGPGLVGFSPVVDGELVTVDLQQAFEEGSFVRITFGNPTLNTSAQIIDFINTERWLSYSHNLTTTSAGGKKLLAAYPDDEDAYSPYSASDGLLTKAGAGAMARRSYGITGDTLMIGPRRRISHCVASPATGDAPHVWASRFDQVGWNLTIDGGVGHVTDVRYAFSNPLVTVNTLGPKPRDKALAKEMTTYWVSFVVALDPNTHKLDSSPHWPRYDSQDPKNIRLTNRADGTKTLIESDTWRKDGIDLLMDIRYQGVKAGQDRRKSGFRGTPMLWEEDASERERSEL